jgi:arsenate reductase-like glutaredoxin family protein
MSVLWFFETKSVIKTHRRYITQYGKDPPSDNAIRRWLKQFQETGSVLNRKGAAIETVTNAGEHLEGN